MKYIIEPMFAMFALHSSPHHLLKSANVDNSSCYFYFLPRAKEASDRLNEKVAVFCVEGFYSSTLSQTCTVLRFLNYCGRSESFAFDITFAYA